VRYWHWLSTNQKIDEWTNIKCKQPIITIKLRSRIGKPKKQASAHNHWKLTKDYNSVHSTNGFLFSRDFHLRKIRNGNLFLKYLETRKDLESEVNGGHAKVTRIEGS
jgi:hypothetical protein